MARHLSFKDLLHLHFYVSACLYVHVYVGARWSQKRTPDPLELALQGSASYPTWVLGAYLLFFARAASVFHHWAFSPVAPFVFLTIDICSCLFLVCPAFAALCVSSLPVVQATLYILSSCTSVFIGCLCSHCFYSVVIFCF